MYARDFRARAREILAGKWGMAILVTLIAGIFGGLVAGSPFEFNLNLDENGLSHIPETLRDIALVYLSVAASIGGVLAVLQFIVGGVVKLGYCQYLLKLHDGQEGELKDLFSQFSRFAEGFVLSLLTAIYTFLWTLLFIIPGIVAAYKYSMAPFILLENPGMKPDEAITASKELMDGNKGRLFCLDLSFIGWELLCGFTLGIGNLWLNPYKNAAHAAFYRSLSPRPAVVEAVAEEIPEAEL